MALPKGVATTVGELLNSIPQYVFSELSLMTLYSFAGQFARKVCPSGEASLDGIVAKSLCAAFFTTRECFTRREFLTCCQKVVEQLYKRINSLPASLATHLNVALKTALERLSKASSSPLIATFFKDVLIEETVTTSSKTLQAARAVTSTAAEEVLENVSKFTRASQSAKSALKFGAIIDGTVAFATIGYNGYRYSQGEINGREFKRVAIRRSSAAVGSVGMSAAGSFIGTLIFPGVGTFIGGMVGGIAGDYTGSWYGGMLDDVTQ